MDQTGYRYHELMPADLAKESNTLTYLRQLSLIRSLRQNPQRSVHVKKLRWTTIRTSDEVREKELDLATQRLANNEITLEEHKSIKHELQFFECNSISKTACFPHMYNPANCKPGTLWRTFSLFTKVRCVELFFSRQVKSRLLRQEKR